MKNKLVKRILVFAIIAAAAAGGLYGGLRYRSANMTAEVVSVDSLNTGYWGDEAYSSGLVTNDYSQTVELDEGAVIKEVFVEEGQEVHEGDKLLELDTTAATLDYNKKVLEVENLQNKIDIAQNELKILKNTTPYDPPVQVEEIETSGTDSAEAADGTDGAVSAETEVETDGMNSGEATDKTASLETTDDITSGETTEGTDSAEAADSTAGVVTDETDAAETVTYTSEELKELIAEKEQEISELDLSKRKAQLEVDKLELSDVTERVIYAAVDGTVRDLQDKDNLPTDGTPFLTVSGSEGLYVTGSLSELLLDEVQPGQTVSVMSWESGNSYEAVIKEISTYPTTNEGYGSDSNTNVSYYPYTAYIEDTSGLRNGEYVDLTMTIGGDEDGASIFISRGYVRTEDGRSYALKADENNRLVKQYVSAGRVVYGDTIEIKSGLTTEDRIAFPYGKTAKEGVRVTDSE